MSKTITIINKNSEETVAALLKSQGLESSIDFHCREGFCGACKCKKVKGDIEYTTEPLAYLEDDEFTPCIAKITGNKNLIIKTS